MANLAADVLLLTCYFPKSRVVLTMIAHLLWLCQANVQRSLFHVFSCPCHRRPTIKHLSLETSQHAAALATYIPSPTCQHPKGWLCWSYWNSGPLATATVIVPPHPVCIRPCCQHNFVDTSLSRELRCTCQGYDYLASAFTTNDTGPRPQIPLPHTFT